MGFFDKLFGGGKKPSDDLQKLHEEGRTLLRAREYEKAIACFSRVIQCNPSDPEPFLSRGVAYDAGGRPDEAIADFTQAIRLRPDDAIAYSNRANTHFLAERHDKAIADYTQAIALDSTNPLRYGRRGQAYAKKGDYDRAIADFTEGLRLWSSSEGEAANKAIEAIEVGTDPLLAADLLLSRGRAYADIGNRERAMNDFADALRLDRKATQEHFFWRGQECGEKGECDREIAEYDIVLQLDPNYTLGYVARGNARLEKEQFDQAIIDCTEAIRLDPKEAKAYFFRGQAYSHTGENEKALVDFTKAILFDPTDPDAHQWRAQIYRTLGETAKALDDEVMARKSSAS
jgi:tetratricopeptide (TPR) repeat protein